MNKKPKEYIKVCNNFSTQFFGTYLPKNCVYGRKYDIRNKYDSSLSIYYYIDNFNWMNENKIPESIEIHVLRGNNKDWRKEHWKTYINGHENEQVWDMMLFCVKNVAKGTKCIKCGNEALKVAPKEKKAQSEFEPIRGRIGWALAGDDWGTSVCKTVEGTSGDWQGDRWRSGANDPVKPLYKQPQYTQKYQQKTTSTRDKIYTIKDESQKVQRDYFEIWSNQLLNYLNRQHQEYRYILVGDCIIKQMEYIHDSKKLWKNMDKKNIPTTLGYKDREEMIAEIGHKFYTTDAVMFE